MYHCHHTYLKEASLDLGKMLSNNFQLNHSFNLGSSSVPSSYHFWDSFCWGQGKTCLCPV